MVFGRLKDVPRDRYKNLIIIDRTALKHGIHTKLTELETRALELRVDYSLGLFHDVLDNAAVESVYAGPGFLG